MTAFTPRKKEKLYIAMLKSIVPIVFAVIIYLFAVNFADSTDKRAKQRMIEPIPISVSKPVLTLKEFEELVTEEPNVIATVLEESEPVGEEYFADAVFAGDSLTDGFRIYDVGQHFDVISYVGLSPSTALTQPVYKAADGETLIMADAIRYIGARKAYILLGTNGLNWTSPEALIEGYSKLVDQLMATNPDTYIILQSIPPVTQATAISRSSYTRERVEYYNSLVKELAVSKGIYFLDVYSAFVGDNGYLSTSISGPDGMHMTPSGYKIWFEYITTHTIKGNSAFTMDNQGRIIPMKPVEEVTEISEDQQETDE